MRTDIEQLLKTYGLTEVLEELSYAIIDQARVSEDKEAEDQLRYVAHQVYNLKFSLKTK